MSFKVLLSKEQIAKQVQELAEKISKDFSGEELIVVGVLKGSFIFLADLVRAMNLPIQIEFMSVSSYEGTESTGELKVALDLSINIKDKNVLLIEDIVDTGLTISTLKKMLGSRQPKSLKISSLLFKPSRLKTPVEIDYLGFEIEDHFVIGYGLDFNGRYRELDYVGIYND